MTEQTVPSADSASKSPQSPRVKRWLKRVAMIGLLLLLVVLAVGWYAKSRARREVIRQLAKVNEGPIEIGDVSIGLNGIQVFDIRLFQPEATEPWAVARKLSVQAPLGQLMSSTPAIDRIEIEEPDLTLQLDADGKLLNSFPASSSSGLPASSIVINNGSLTIAQPGHDSLSANGIDVTVSQENGATKLWGNISEFAGANWNLSGSYRDQQNTFSLNVATESLAFDSNAISRWPLLPPNALTQIEIAGTTSVSIDVNSTAAGTVDYFVDLQPKDVDLQIRPFDLQIQLERGNVQIKNGKMTVRELLAHADGGELHVLGETDFTSWPMTGSFAGDFEKLPVATLRHLAPIPNAAEGFASGETTGSFTIGGESTFAMMLSAKGQGVHATYEGFATEGTQVDVDINSLKLDEKFRLKKLTGEVKVDTTASHLALAKFLDRFQIKREGTAPRIDGDAKAEVDLLIPLATAADVGSWSLTVNAVSEEVRLASKLLKDVSANIGIEAGMLTFNKLTGNVFHDRLGSDPAAENGRVSMTGKWPFVQDRLASFEIKGTEVSVEWLMGIAKDYSADVEQVLKMIDPDFEKETSSLGGNLTVTVKVEFPPAAAKDVSKWTITGEVTAGEISIDRRSINHIRSRFKLADRRFTLENFDGELNGGGTISISGSVPLDSKQEDKIDAALEQVPAKFDVKWQRVPIAFLSDLAGISPRSVGGEVSGNLHIDKSIAHGEKPAAWSASGAVSVNQLALGDNTLDEIHFRITTEDGLISASDFRYAGDPIGFDLLATIAASAPYDFKINTQLKDFEIARLTEIDAFNKALKEYSPFKGVVQFDAQVSGSLQPFKFATLGTGSIMGLEIAQRSFDDISGSWQLDASDLENARASLNVFGGSIRLAELLKNPARIVANIEDIDVEQMAMSLNLPGTAKGKITGRLSVDNWNRAETRKTALQLSGISSVFAPFYLSEMTGELSYENNRLIYRLSADLLSGQLSVEGETSIPADGWQNVKIPLAFKLVDANLNQLSRDAESYAALSPLRGAIDASFDLNIDGPEFKPTGTGKAGVREVTWKGDLLISTASTLLSLDGKLLDIRELQADLRGGEISGQASYPLYGGQSGSYELNIRRVDLERALIFWPTIAKEASGYFDARIAGTLDRTLTGSGQVAVERASVYDLADQSLRLPIQFQLNMQDFSGRAEVRRTTFRVFDGTVSAKASIEFGNRLNLDAEASLADVDSGELIGMLTNSRDYDQGELSGNLTLKGRSVRSVRDLQGAFRGSLMRSQSFKLPLLDDIGAFLSSGRLTQSTFDSDVIDLQLANGIVKVNKFMFASDLAQVLITGNVSTDKRLDLEVVAQIANLNANPLLQRFVNSPLSRIQPAPTAIATEIARLVSDRLIYVHVGGTTRSPNFQLRTGLILRDEVIQLFFQNATIPGISNIQNIPQNR